ncbi:hypothetical protein PO878_02705 [Iamia majanohamensis]|uniref:Uncharacterized protein n=1 Tax=Iamia majanohamensis TaxID=467976 RepID=A0AAE9YH17_9ACTN|nr:hypothetical protein [Iamia majanohamensis]WCO67631.1 hypothetical protein PO878_02705 [Iamia majanohamensis]
MSQGSQEGDAPPTGVTDAHLADRAAYGAAEAFAALADRFRTLVWTTAALASGDGAVATRAAAGAFTRTLAARAAGIGDPDGPVGPALAATAYELAREGHPDLAPDPVDLPAALATLDGPTRTAAWLTEAQGWAEDAVVDLLRAGAGLGGRDAPAPRWSAAAGREARALALTPPPELVDAAATGWREWQGLEVAIPDRHPLATAVARLDRPLGQVGHVLTRACERLPLGRRGRDATPPAPPAPLLPEEPPADAGLAPTAAADHDADLRTVLPATAEGAASVPAAAGVAPPAGDGARRSTPGAVAATSREDAETSVGVDADIAEDPNTAVGEDDGISVLALPGLDDTLPDDLALPERDRSARQLATAGATPARLRVVAALAAGILTASAVGSLLTADATGGPARPSGASEAAAPATGDGGPLLDDGRPVVPVVATEDDTGPTTRPTEAAAPPAPSRPGTTPTTAGRPDAPAPTSGGAGRTLPAPAPAPSGGGGPTGGGGGAPVGGGGTDAPAPSPAPSPAPAPAPAPPPTPTPAPSPTPSTAAPTTTTAPAPTTTTRPQGPVCTVLPLLCP